MPRGNQSNAFGSSQEHSHANTRSRHAASSSQANREEDESNHIRAATIAKIMRRVIPSGAHVSDGAKEAVQLCVTEFIGIITGEANEHCAGENRKRLTSEDLLYALSKLGFEEYVGLLTLYLNRYREFEANSISVQGEPTAHRVLNYQNLVGPQLPVPSVLPPPPLPAPVLFNPYVAPPPLPLPPPPPPPAVYFISPAQAMNSYQGYGLAYPGGAHGADSSYGLAGPASGYPSNTPYPPPPEDNPGSSSSGQFFR